MSESEGCELNCTCIKCKGKKRVIRIEETSDSDDSPVENAIKRKKVLRVMSDGAESSESDSFNLLVKKKKRKRAPKVMSDEEVSSPIQPRRNISARIVSESESSKYDSSGIDDNEDVDLSNVSDSDSEGSRTERGSSSSDWESDFTTSGDDEDIESGILTLPVTPDKKPLPKPSSSSVSASAAAMSDSGSSDGESEKCPICLRSFTSQEVGTPESCDHSFCAMCLQEWAKNVNTCPVDRQAFTLILVRRRVGGKIIRQIAAEAPAPREDNADEENAEDPTFCETCSRSDQEDRMLLCDGCDSGYHLDCLNPPLRTVPIEEWFCPECVTANNMQGFSGETDIVDGELMDLLADGHAFSSSPIRPRVLRLLPRTRQSERVRETIRSIYQVEAANRPSTSSGIDSVDGASRHAGFFGSGPSTVVRKKKKTGVRSRKARKTKTKRSATTKKRSTTTKKRKTTTKKRKTKKTTTKRKKKLARLLRLKPRRSVKGRLAEQLGLRAPRTAGRLLPEVRTRSAPVARSMPGMPTLHIFGQPDQLDYFSSASDMEGDGGPGGAAVASRPRTSAARNERNLAARKLLSPGAIRSHAVVSQQTPCDLISSILDSQAVWHSKKAVVSINRDRTFTVKNDSLPKKPEPIATTKDLPLPTIEPPIQADPINVNETMATGTQAPMYPGRGSGGSRPPPGGGFSNYNNNSGQRYNNSSGGGGGQQGGRSYSNYGPPASGFDIRDNRAGYTDYLRGGPPLPFRGGSPPVRFRMPQRFPLRAPFTRRPLREPPPPPEVNADEGGWKSNDEEDKEDEEIDIYSDIEVAGPGTEPEFESLPPPPAPSALLIGLGDQPMSDDESDTELVIDDNVPAAPSPVLESDKYDPAEPCSDSDSLDGIALPSGPDQTLTNSNSLPSPSYDDSCSQPADGAVSKAVKEVLKGHIEASSSANEDKHSSDEEDEECPNFSIYSATSMDIARNTDSEPVVEPAVGEEEKAPAEVVDEPKHDSDTPPLTDGKSVVSEPGNLGDADDDNACDGLPVEVFKDKQDEAETELERTEVEEIEKETEKEKKKEELKDDEVKSSEVKEDEDKDEAMEEGQIMEDGSEDADETLNLSLTSLKLKKVSLVEEIFGSDEESLIGGATSPVSAVSSAHTPPQSPRTGLEGLDTEAISETEEAHFDDLSETSFATVEEDGELPSSVKKKKKKGRLSSESKKSGDDRVSPQDPVDYEEGEIVDERPKKDKVADKPAEKKTETEVKVSDENVDTTRKPSKSSEEDKKKKKKKSTEKRSSRDRAVLGSKENNKEKSSRDKSRKDDPNIAWKKPNKAKERNYRDGKVDKNVSKEKDQSKKRNSSKEKDSSSSRKDKEKEKEKEREKDRKKKDKRQDMERYNVRKMVDNKKRTKRRDEFGRDLSRDHSHGSSRSRSPSYDKSRGRSRSGSKTRSNRERRSPMKTARKRSRSKSRRRSRSKSRHRTRTKSPVRSRARPKSKARSKTSRSKERLNRSRTRKSRSRSRNRPRIRTRSRTPIRSRDRAKDRVEEVRPAKPVYKPSTYRRSLSRGSWTPSWSGSVTGSSFSRSRSSSQRPRYRSYSRSYSRSWTPERRLPVAPKKSGGINKTAKKLTVTVSNTKEIKKREKKKRELRRKQMTGSEKRKKRKDKSPAPSKEVFTSGDNILVSVNFNKSSKNSKDSGNAGGTKDTAKRKLTEDSNRDPTKKLRKGKPMQKGIQARLGAKKIRRSLAAKLSRVAAAAKKKPMAIIDLDQSPFREQTPSPRDLIVLSDSDDEVMDKQGGDQADRRARENNSASPKGSSKAGTNTATNVSESQSPIMSGIGSYLVTSTGPKTPPEPQIKFSIAPKATLRSIMNPLQEEEEEDEDIGDDAIMDNIDRRIEEELNRSMGEMLHKGPNTPPEPRGPSTPCFSPTSPDAYDPFDPTKSGTPSPAGPGASPSATPIVDLTGGPKEDPAKKLDAGPTDEGKEGAVKSPEKESNAETTKSPAVITLSPTPVETLNTSQESAEKEKTTVAAANPEPILAIPVAAVTQTSKPSPTKVFIVKPIPISQQPITLSAPVATPVFPALTSANIATMLRTPPPSASRVGLYSQPPPSIPQLLAHAHHHHQFGSPAAPPRILPDKAKLLQKTPALLKPSPQKSTAVKASPLKNAPLRALNGDQKAVDKSTDVVDMDLESPYSPASSEANDLFEPPVDLTKRPAKKHKSPMKPGDKFDAMFGESPLNRNKRPVRAAAKHMPKNKPKVAPIKALPGKQKKEVGIKMNEDKLQILDELPSSAVELQVKDKYLKKLNRQERVVEEVKLSLKPHYAKKHVTKEEYKDILRRSVPKICHNRSGEINPQKIASLVEAYVKKARYNKKKSTGKTRAKTQWS